MSEASIVLPLPGNSATFHDAIVLERGQDRRTLLRILSNSRHREPLSRRLTQMVSEQWQSMFEVPLPCNSLVVAHIGSGDADCVALREVLNELLAAVA